MASREEFALLMLGVALAAVALWLLHDLLGMD